MKLIRLSIFLTCVAIGLVLAGLTAGAQQPPAFTPLTDEVLRNPPAADWPMWRRTYNSWGHSPLDQINRSNVRNLQLAWSFAMVPNNRSEQTPLVANGITQQLDYLQQ